MQIGREGRTLIVRDAVTPGVQVVELLPEPSSAVVISSCLARRAASPAEGWVRATIVDLRSLHTILSASWERSVSGFLQLYVFPGGGTMCKAMMESNQSPNPAGVNQGN